VGGGGRVDATIVVGGGCTSHFFPYFSVFTILTPPHLQICGAYYLSLSNYVLIR